MRDELLREALEVIVKTHPHAPEFLKGLESGYWERVLPGRENEIDPTGRVRLALRIRAYLSSTPAQAPRALEERIRLVEAALRSIARAVRHAQASGQSELEGLSEAASLILLVQDDEPTLETLEEEGRL